MSAITVVPSSAANSPHAPRYYCRLHLGCGLFAGSAKAAIGRLTVKNTRMNRDMRTLQNQKYHSYQRHCCSIKLARHYRDRLAASHEIQGHLLPANFFKLNVRRDTPKLSSTPIKAINPANKGQSSHTLESIFLLTSCAVGFFMAAGKTRGNQTKPKPRKPGPSVCELPRGIWDIFHGFHVASSIRLPGRRGCTPRLTDCTTLVFLLLRPGRRLSCAKKGEVEREQAGQKEIFASK